MESGRMPGGSERKVARFPEIAEGHDFHLVFAIEPLRMSDGTVRAYWPQSRYANRGSLPLNRYGNGPFCKFKVPGDLRESGVYAITIDGELRYIGKCENLTLRFNNGYGNISPRNCFIGGQETNCRINNLIYRDSNAGRLVDVWFCATDHHEDKEKQLLNSLKLAWHRAMARSLD